MPNSTTTEVVKALYKPPYNIGKLDSFIRYRVKRLAAEGIIQVSRKSRKMIYNVDSSKVFFGWGVMLLEDLGDVGIGYFIVVKKEDGIIAASIDAYESRVGAKKFFSEKSL